MKTINNEQGFTLIELILCVAILGMLMAAVSPSFSTLLANSANIGAKGTMGAVQSAVNTRMAENVLSGSPTMWPASLEPTATVGSCSTLVDGCFGAVIAQPLRDKAWTKTGPLSYKFENYGVAQTYTYDASIGQILCMSGC